MSTRMKSSHKFLLDVMDDDIQHWLKQDEDYLIYYIKEKLNNPRCENNDDIILY